MNKQFIREDLDIPYVENPVIDLGINKKNSKFFSVDDVQVENIENIKVFDLEVSTNENYHLTEVGIVHNGGGKRKGSIAIYLEPWHADIFDFIELRKNHGKEELRARDLFLALWVSDLFMKRVEEDRNWTLFSPDEAPGLDECYGEEFEKLYEKYEAEGKGRRTIRARSLWEKIVESQIETGTPYMLYKDNANKKSNQKNIGTLKGSNLCVTGDTNVLCRINREEISTNMIELHSFIERGLAVEILSRNLESSQDEWKAVTASLLTDPSAEILEITTPKGNVLYCTPDHKIWTQRGYVEAKNLLETDEIIEYTSDI